MLDVAIIGGGLSGLYLAHQLQQRGRSFELFEARSRLGGRILSRSVQGGFNYDLGPGWIWPDSQPRIARLVRSQGLKTYPQWLAGDSLYLAAREMPAQRYRDPATYADARRIQGGMVSVVENLVQQLPKQRLHTEHRLEALTDAGEYILLNVDHAGTQRQLFAHQVVLCLPPRLLVERVAFNPELAPPLQRLMQETPTWMAGQAKALIRYRRPFWREQGLSGALLSGYQGAALGEVFDAGDENGGDAALSGFFALPAELRRLWRDDLEALLLDQLVRAFGPEAATPESIQIQDWADEPLTAVATDAQPLRAHPDYGHPWFELDHWNDKLHFCGTETATEFGGYLEGALESAERVARALNLSEQTAPLRLDTGEQHASEFTAR